MHQDTIRSDFAADVKLIRCEQAGPPLAAALRSWKIAASVALLASGLVGRFSISPSGVPREHGEADVLYHTDGKGHFVPVSWIDGTFLDEEGNPLSTPPYDWGLGVMFRDLNGDGAPDLYVCNDSHSPDRIWINLGRGRFQAIARTAIRKTSLSSMGVDVADINRDGLDEIFVLDMLSRDHQINNVLKAEKKLTSVQQLFLRKLLPSYATSPKIYRNRGDLTFEDRSREWGFSYVGVSQGMCLADLDNDGDLDVVVNNLNGPAGIYGNESSAPRVAVRLKGLPPNTRGIGAKIWLYGGAVPMQSQEMICGGRYLSSDDAMRVFAAGSLTNEMRIEVKWRSGKRSVMNGVMANRIYEIDEVGAAS